MDVDDVISVLANVLYHVKTRKISVRKAFTEVCRTHKCSSREYTREELYQLSRLFISKYYTLKYLCEKHGRLEPTHRVLARLFLYLYLTEKGVKPPSKLKKTVLRDLPGLKEGLEEVEAYIKYSFPKWMYYEFLDLLGSVEVEELFSALNKRVLWLRVNTLKIDVDKAVRELDETGVRVEVDRDIPYLLRVVESKKPIRTHRLFREGAIIPQDKASVLVVEALKPEPGSLVYDFAAAPGVKSSLVMQLTENKARIIAIDASPRRLEAMKKLLKLYGVDDSRVKLVLGDGRYITLREYGDYGLVDAPCSSSGAISKDPAIKIFLEEDKIVFEMKKLQIGILSNALKHAERVVYATCSLMPEEGEEVVLETLSQSINHELREPRVQGSHGYRKYPIHEKVKRLFPHLHATEGFFIARLEK